MGNCPSSSRAQFKPDHGNDTRHETDIILSAATDKDAHKSEVCATENEADTSETATPTTVNGTSESGAGTDGSTALLKAKEVDLCIPENTVMHHTVDFNSFRKNPRLILRRGSLFHLRIMLNRQYKYEKDVLCVALTLKDAEIPSYAQNTQVLVPLQLEGNFSTEALWQGRITSSVEKTVIAEVESSPSSIVGEWIVEIETRPKNDVGKNVFRFKVKDPVILLFNPWCASDSVFLSLPAHCEEYVMNDSGLIWRGTHSRLKQCVWNFSQFEENVLEYCLYLLTQVGALPIWARADPLLVIRHLAAVMIYRNGTGLLVENLSGNYKGGVQPTAWSGSQYILRSFYKSKKPVKYGQCWVYAGVLTTVCRALGIPSRPVTNYLSARNTHGSMTVDSSFGSENELVRNHTSGSVWSFHVWTEVWMQRPDLKPGCYDGWQAVDAAPHEEGSCVSGPSSVIAIRRKEIKKPFSTSTFFAEINAEKVFWRYYGPDQPSKLLKTSLEGVGMCISTKAIGKFEREDITHEYKETEGNVKVRDAMLCSLIQNKEAFSRYYVNDNFQDVYFDFSLPDDVIIGETFAVKLKATNKNEKKSYSVKINLRVDSALYTGEIMQLVKSDIFEITLGPNVENEMTMSVPYSEYAKAISDQFLFNICASAHVIETEFDFFAQDDFRMRMPRISVQIDGEVFPQQPLTVTASFTNPLPIPLRNGMFTIEGPGLGKPLTQKVRGSVQPKAEGKVNFKVIPQSSGMKTIVVKFQSKELMDVEGYHLINISSRDLPLSEKESNSHL